MAGGLNKDTDERILEELIKSSSAGRLLTFDETAEVVKYLLTAPDKINGANISVRAGMDLDFLKNF